MPAPPDDARSLRGRVLRTSKCGADAVLLTVGVDRELAPVRASRFFMLRRTDGVSPLIPRPFSLYRQRGEELDFLIQVLGRGTRALASAPPATPLTVIGPLGNGWPPLDPHGPPWVGIAGGVGSAPFYLALQQAREGVDGTPLSEATFHLLFGAASADRLYDLEGLRSFGYPVHVATDDGSAGRRGNVLELLEALQAEGRLAGEVRLLACGPDPMLRAVERWARERGLSAWLSLETLMGCGVGICNGCPVATRPEGPLGAWPNAKCCVEGPVFSVDAITLCEEGR